jgi:hypothetical protein
MPRTTNNQYLEHHRAAQQVWQHYPSAFATLSPADQWRIHAYYQTQSTTPDHDLLTERDRLSVEQPSLPQAAGKAYVQLRCSVKRAIAISRDEQVRFEDALAYSALLQRHRHPKNRNYIDGVVLPTPNIDLLTKAFLYASEELLERLDEDADQAA